MKKGMFLTLGLLGLLMLTGGCAVPGYNAQQNQALNKAGGAAIGAVAGQAIGRSTKGTLIGAGIRCRNRQTFGCLPCID